MNKRTRVCNGRALSHHLLNLDKVLTNIDHWYEINSLVNEVDVRHSLNNLGGVTFNSNVGSDVITIFNAGDLTTRSLVRAIVNFNSQDYYITEVIDSSTVRIDRNASNNNTGANLNFYAVQRVYNKKEPGHTRYLTMSISNSLSAYVIRRAYVTGYYYIETINTGGQTFNEVIGGAIIPSPCTSATIYFCHSNYPRFDTDVGNVISEFPGDPRLFLLSDNGSGGAGTNYSVNPGFLTYRRLLNQMQNGAMAFAASQTFKLLNQGRPVTGSSLPVGFQVNRGTSLTGPGGIFDGSKFCMLLKSSAYQTDNSILNRVAARNQHIYQI